MSTQLRTEVRQAVADVFGLDTASVSDASSPENVPAWDSIGHLNLDVYKRQTYDWIYGEYLKKHALAPS